ncbi:MAG: type II toxin-antitoxin system PrlF family antitoxin [Actinomycetota bacterium]|nr:type II toxin-antitoxin system PrlF family antitoxin [Actinomycetota bacterium]
MTTKSVLSAKGQVTIPAPVRKALGLKPGDRIAYKIDKDRAELIPIKGTILDAAGSIKPKTKGETLTEIRAAVKKRVAKAVVEKEK